MDGGLILLLRIAAVVLFVYLGFGALLYFTQRSLIYMPVADRHDEAQHVEWISSGTQALKLWVVSPGHSRALIYFGGNAEDVFYTGEDFRRRLPGYSVYLVNYRGYGGSTGRPSEQALYADALEIHDSLRQRHEQIGLVGRSLGSAVAAYLAAQRPVARLVLVTAPDSALAIAGKAYPLYPVSLLLKDTYPSVRHAPLIEAPTLLLIAGRDRIVPPAHSLNLLDHFRPGVAEEVTIPDAGHNDISMFPGYWEALRRFLAVPEKHDGEP